MYGIDIIFTEHSYYITRYRRYLKTEAHRLSVVDRRHRVNVLFMRTRYTHTPTIIIVYRIPVVSVIAY